MTSPHATTLLDSIGDTPLIRLGRFPGERDVRLFAKLESANPSGSAKDRTARELIRDAVERGILQDGSTIVESSSGNLGVALAREAVLGGWAFHCVVDGRSNRSTVDHIAALGGTVHEVTEPDPDTGDWLTARRMKVEELKDTLPDAVCLDQYSNLAAFTAHDLGSMSEIVAQLGHAPDYLVVAVSTTGTVGGCLRHIERNDLHTQVIAVDSEGSVLFGGKRGERTLPGFGAGMVPSLSDNVHPHHIRRVSDIDSVIGARQLARSEAVLAGASGGAVVSVVKQLCEEIPKGSDVVMILHDSGINYLQTVYNDDWVQRTLGVSPEELEKRIG